MPGTTEISLQRLSIGYRRFGDATCRWSNLQVTIILLRICPTNQSCRSFLLPQVAINSGKIGLPFWSHYEDVHYNHPVDVGGLRPSFTGTTLSSRCLIHAAGDVQVELSAPLVFEEVTWSEKLGLGFVLNKEATTFKGNFLRSNTGLNWSNVFSPRKLVFYKLCCCMFPP